MLFLYYLYSVHCTIVVKPLWTASFDEQICFIRQPVTV